MIRKTTTKCDYSFKPTINCMSYIEPELEPFIARDYGVQEVEAQHIQRDYLLVAPRHWYTLDDGTALVNCIHTL
jgi:hypothetical protein